MDQPTEETTERTPLRREVLERTLERYRLAIRRRLAALDSSEEHVLADPRLWDKGPGQRSNPPKSKSEVKKARAQAERVRLAAASADIRTLQECLDADDATETVFVGIQAAIQLASNVLLTAAHRSGLSQAGGHEGRDTINDRVIQDDHLIKSAALGILATSPAALREPYALAGSIRTKLVAEHKQDWKPLSVPTIVRRLKRLFPSTS